MQANRPKRMTTKSLLQAAAKAPSGVEIRVFAYPQAGFSGTPFRVWSGGVRALYSAIHQGTLTAYADRGVRLRWRHGGRTVTCYARGAV